MSPTWNLWHGDCIEMLRELPEQYVHTCVTSPPYFGLRDYGVEGQIGLEETPEAYIARLVEVFENVRRVLRDDGTLWLNLGDSYARNPSKGGSGPGGKNRAHYGENYGEAQTRRVAHSRLSGGAAAEGVKEKDMIGIPWMAAFALRSAGWYLRQDIIWHKPNVMPESVRDRCTKAHEYIFLLTKSGKYYFDAEAVKEPEVCGRKRGPALHPDLISTNGNSGLARRESTGFRNRRSVWSVPTKPYKGAHFATFPPDLIRPCILAGAPLGGLVLDPFTGSGTTGAVAIEEGRSFIGSELNADYIALAEQRIGAAVPDAAVGERK